MSTPSNSYAEKIFSEHPISLWALDDQVDYFSIISEADRDLSNWTITVQNPNFPNDPNPEHIVPEEVSMSGEPFPLSKLFSIVGPTIDSDVCTIQMVSSDIVNISELDQDLSTFSVGSYIYSAGPYLTGIQVGYEYYDTTNGKTVQNLKTYTVSLDGKWMFVSETFDPPAENTEVRLVIKVSYTPIPDVTEYQFFINGISFGQWSEEFNSTSLGTPLSGLEDLPAISGIESSYGIKAYAYGLSDLSGYYLSRNSRIFAKNSGVPLVYGATGVTSLIPNGTDPSLVIPGNGFLNDSGRYKEMTFEMWVRLMSDTQTYKRIFGPVSSTDGIYVNGPFISIRIGDSVGSYFVGDWYRPMLLHFSVSENSAVLLMNGEQIISISYDTESIDLPDEFSTADGTQYQNDWLGFYAHSDVYPFELDCVAIYSYRVPAVVAKRRWVYGQAVEFPEDKNTAYSGSSVVIDYPFSKYTNNYSYPGLGTWNQATVDNFTIDSGNLNSPIFSAPTASFDNRVSGDWLDDIQSIQSDSENILVRMRPDKSWSETSGHILLDGNSGLKDKVDAFYGVFKQTSQNTQPQVLIHVDDQQTGDYFQLRLGLDNIEYVLKTGTAETVFYSVEKFFVGEKFSAGISVPFLSNYFGGSVSAFFSRGPSLKYYVGGSKDFESTFTGNIYAAGLCTTRNYSKISQYFAPNGVLSDHLRFVYVDGGTPDATAWQEYLSGGAANSEVWEFISDGGNISERVTVFLQDHIASYTFKPQMLFDRVVLDVQTDSYWEDYIPLTYFGKYVVDPDGDSRYALNFMQFNINYPAPSVYVQEDVSGSWTYSELLSEYSSPFQRKYTSLDNQLFTNFENYNDLKNKSTKTYKYDTSNSMVRTFITFQYIESGANAVSGYFTTTKLAPKYGIVEPGADGEDWTQTRYEVVDNMVIYPPNKVDFRKLAIVVSIEAKNTSSTQNPLKIRSLQIASQAFDKSMANEIGTRFGIPMYPYKKNGLYYDYDGKNPFTIYKGSTPYLYLTRTSGIKLRGTYDPMVNRGISIPINESKSKLFKAIAMQTAIRYDEDFFPYAPTEIFEIEGRESYIKFYLVANHPSGKRAKIYGVNAKTGRIEDGIAFYLNGKLVKEPNISIKEWNMLGISFAGTINFGDFVGAIRLNGPMTFNLISYYQSTNLQEVQEVQLRPWFQVKRSGELTLDWQYWEDSGYIWQEVLVISSNSLFGVSPEDIYKSYTGTNRIIIDDDRQLKFGNAKYSVFKDLSWQSETLKAI
jgi:hypothetical protein